MRRVQAAALDLFEARGYDAVTIEDIARAAEVSAPTVYRNFGSKERIVLWDEYDPSLLDDVAARLATAPPLAAVRDALEAALDRIYADDRDRILRRTRLLMRHPALRAASAGDQTGFRDALAAVLRGRRAVPDELDAAVLAAAVVGALAVAVEHWERQDGKVALGTILRRAFARLEAPAAPRRRGR
ncbi:MAG: TetR family transcriptional regulator [Kofleriaceae bacterium]|nr:TetR family transcriptional regulator [Kofleriaceae bacterium]